jgi:hypothetical protein
MRVLVFTVALWAFSATAEELPTNLLLKCEGKVTMLIEGLLPNESKFETTLRLRDGELSDTGSIWLTAKGCQLRNGVVRCESKAVVDLKTIFPQDKGSERRELKSFIVRDTGEYNMFLETWSFEGSNGTGKQKTNSKVRRTGVCRPISQPIF